MRPFMKEILPAFVAAAFAFTLVTLIWIGKSYFEAQSYNHVTGSNLSTWDAMWIDLRVQEGVRKE